MLQASWNLLPVSKMSLGLCRCLVFLVSLLISLMSLVSLWAQSCWSVIERVMRETISEPRSVSSLYKALWARGATGINIA